MAAEKEHLVLLPGMMCDDRLFRPQIERFSQSHAVIAKALVGRSTIDGLATALLAQLPSRFNLAGLSMGGIVAMAMAAQAPERIMRLALLDTNHRADPLERRAVRERQIAEIRAGRLREVIVEEMKPNYLATANRQNSALLDLLVEMALDLGGEVFIEQSKALRDRKDATARLRRLTMPSLVLCGEEDRLCPPERHREIAGLLPHAELRVIAGAGHITTLEEPAAVNAALADWLARPLSVKGE